MRLRRLSFVLVAASLCACGPQPTTGPLPPTVSVAPTASVRQPYKSLHLAVARSAHTATTLLDGRVLVTGGFAGSEAGLGSTELFDPATEKFAQGPTLLHARLAHTATRLNDGRVLIVGGLDNGRYLSSAELYDPTTDTFAETGPLLEARSGHGAVLLEDGQVLIVGGVGAGWTFLASAEIYDPARGTFAPTGSMQTARESHTATLLADGRVLVVGGHSGQRRALEILAAAEIYDPARSAFQAVGSLRLARHKHDAVLLADGRVLILGGADARDEQGQLASAELFDPATGAFEPTADMNLTRYKIQGTSLRLPDGRVAVLGGPGRLETFDPTTNAFALSTVDLGPTRLFAAVAPLADGRLLVTGGYGSGISASDGAWVVDLAPCPQGSPSACR